jgi:hypothetical protein
MIRRTSRVAKALLMTLAAPAALLAAAPPASAAASPSIICETSGTSCIGADSITVGSVVTEVPTAAAARSLILSPRPNDYQGFPTYWLEFSAHTNLCIGVNPSAPFFVQVQTCSTGTGVVWAKSSFNNGDIWINRFDTQNNNGIQLDLSGIEVQGSQYEIAGFKSPKNDYFQRFTTSPAK